MRWKAFTIIELLVVISIIALLTAILIPALQNSRRQARAALCGSNIKQLVLGLTMYETENGTFPYSFDNTHKEPPPGGYPGYLQYDRMGWWWFNRITDYSQEDPMRNLIIWCPSRQIRDNALKYNVLSGNYGVNQSICKSSQGKKSQAEFIGTPLRAADIPHPSQALLIVDAGYSMINWWHATSSPPVSLGSTIEDTAYIPGLSINRERDLWPSHEEDAIYGRHPHKTVNVGFVDSHISRIKADDLFVEKTGDTFKNLSPLWLPK
jgi:prepilin-type N-terminal cleavage/methylation domain-containing protein/prepilin-type processing-associated H-X9-DG protein